MGATGETIARIALWCGNFGGISRLSELFSQGLSPDQALALMDAASASLERLGVESVQLFLPHELDPEVPWPRGWPALRGCVLPAAPAPTGSNADAEQLEQAFGAGDPAAVQKSSRCCSVLPLCEAPGVTYLGFGPGRRLADRQVPARTAYPWLSDGPAPGALRGAGRREDLQRARCAARVRRQRGISIAGAALAWLLADLRIGQIVRAGEPTDVGLQTSFVDGSGSRGCWTSCGRTWPRWSTKRSPSDGRRGRRRAGDRRARVIADGAGRWPRRPRWLDGPAAARWLHRVRRQHRPRYAGRDTVGTAIARR